ncbi:DUF167 domain-containing protein [Aliiroseovarius sp. PTFE2010]|uniref:DUF167 domain-containing protein n=1 Tax=Aliiroseovarius sp. PTFE2010 TaxID=3417190 RepID=UPI003CF14223
MADIADLSDLAVSGAEIAVRVTPKASRNRLTRDGDAIRVYVTALPAGGQANTAAIALLSKGLGIAKSRISLKRGGRARDKVFVINA